MHAMQIFVEIWGVCLQKNHHPTAAMIKLKDVQSI
jgi:hypothetical protein